MNMRLTLFTNNFQRIQSTTHFRVWGFTGLWDQGFWGFGGGVGLGAKGLRV